MTAARVSSPAGRAGFSQRRRAQLAAKAERVELVDKATALVDDLDKMLGFTLCVGDKASADLLLGDLWRVLERVRGLDDA